MSVVLSLCDRTGTMVQPWADAGHECWAVDDLLRRLGISVVGEDPDGEACTSPEEGVDG